MFVSSTFLYVNDSFPHLGAQEGRRPKANGKTRGNFENVVLLEFSLPWAWVPECYNTVRHDDVVSSRPSLRKPAWWMRTRQTQALSAHRVLCFYDKHGLKATQEALKVSHRTLNACCDRGLLIADMPDKARCVTLHTTPTPQLPIAARPVQPLGLFADHLDDQCRMSWPGTLS